MKKLDLTLDNMDNSRFNYVYGQLVSTMDTTLFSRTKLLCIAMVFNKFVMQNGPGAKYMTVIQLSRILRVMFKISSERINDRIVRTICYDTDCRDSGFSAETHCALDSFIKLFTIYFSGDMEQRMKFVFDIYDEEGHGTLSRPIVMYYIEEFFEGEDEDDAQECRTDMLELLFHKFDLDKDTFISYEEYTSIVLEHPELMEFLGTVFPSPQTLDVIAHCLNLCDFKRIV